MEARGEDGKRIHQADRFQLTARNKNVFACSINSATHNTLASALISRRDHLEFSLVLLLERSNTHART